MVTRKGEVVKRKSRAVRKAESCFSGEGFGVTEGDWTIIKV